MDIQSREDITAIVHDFYQKAMDDDFIGHFFNDVIHLDLEVHLPKIIDFWESVLFGNAKYQGNPVLKHIHLHQMSALTQDHFDRWLFLWEKIINRHYKGKRTMEAIEKAEMMAKLMMYKIKASEESGFVQ